MKSGRKENCIELSETIYEDYESSKIRRSTFVISMNTFNECVFYDDNDNVVAKFKLPIDVYNEPFGLTISYDNTKVFLQRWRTELRCYSLPDGKILWRSKLKRVNYVFSFENLLFCKVYEKGIYVVDANTGEVIEKLIKIPGYFRVYRISREVFFVYREHKILCYNMATGKSWTPDIKLGLEGRIRELIAKDELDPKAYSNSYIIQYIQDLGDRIIIKFITTKLDRKNDEVFKEILKQDLINAN